MVKHLIALAALTALASCIDSPVEPIAMPLAVAGTSATEPVVTRGDVPVTLERADLAFGPLTLCAGEQAGDNCQSALVEWTESVVVDALDPAPVSVGELVGVSGTARSYMYDLGYVSLLVSTDPLELAAATELGGASLVLEGSAEVEGDIVPFALRLRFVLPADVERGSTVVRSRADSGFGRALADGDPLTVRFDPAPWIRGGDFRALRQDEECAEETAVVCGGPIERSCTESGVVERDCAALGMVCQPDVGCTERIAIDATSQIGSAVRTAVLAGARPTFE